MYEHEIERLSEWVAEHTIAGAKVTSMMSTVPQAVTPARGSGAAFSPHAMPCQCPTRNWNLVWAGGSP